MLLLALAGAAEPCAGTRSRPTVNATSSAAGDGSAKCATQTLAAPGGSCRPSSECRRAWSSAHASRYLQFSKKYTLRRDGTCPGGTVVSAKCADRSAFGENPYACTALQQLAALSSFLQKEAPWNDHRENVAYCPTGSLYVECATVGKVQLPTLVGGTCHGLAGRVGRGQSWPPTCLRMSAGAPTSPNILRLVPARRGRRGEGGWGAVGGRGAGRGGKRT